MKRNRITRKSLKLKLIGGASALFMAVALIATGFAAWIISSNAKAEANLGISVATVSNSVMTVTVDGVDADENLDQRLIFESIEGDTGRVSYLDSGNGGRESLTITLKGTVTNAQHLGALSVAIDYSNTNLIKAAEAGYITMPENAKTSGVITLANLSDAGKSLEEIQNGYILVAQKDDDGNPIYEYGYAVYEAQFICTLTFGWGEYFGFVNPCYYYDGVDASGDKLAEYDEIMAITTDEIMAQLTLFKQTIDGSIEGGTGSPGQIALTVKTEVN